MGYNASDEELRKAYRKLAIKYASSLEFSSPPHPSWLASRCLRHRVHLLSTQLHLCRVRSHHPVQAYSTLRLLSGTTRISKKTRSRLKSPPRSLGSWVTPTRCSSAGDRERLQPHVPSPGCRPEHPLCPAATLCISGLAESYEAAGLQRRHQPIMGDRGRSP